MVDRSKYRRVPELYTQGVELELKDGSAVYIKALNPYELQEARHDAQVARARIVMALKEHASEELDKVKATFFSDGREGAITRILDHRSSDVLMKATDAVANDPDWQERLDIAARSDDILAKPIEDPERKLLDEINRQYLTEVNERMVAELDFQREQITQMTEEQMLDEYVEMYIDSHGAQSAMAEHSLTEIWYAVRACDGVKKEDGTWDHEACDGHRLQVYESKREIRDLPEELQQAYEAALQALNMTVREAKNSDRQGSSSGSSPLPSEEGASTPSTQTGIPAAVPGT